MINHILDPMHIMSNNDLLIQLVPHLSKKELEQLASLKFKDGTYVTSNQDSVYELASMLDSMNIEDVVRIIPNMKNLTELLWSSDTYNEGRYRENNERNNHYFEDVGSEEIGKCIDFPRCENTKLTLKLAQLRAADEPMSAIITCLGCKKVWVRN